jgi:hypothetical protein
MSEQFEAGQRVRCVDPSENAEASLIRGAIYTVRDCNGQYVYLLGKGGGWRLERFELVDDGVDPSVYARTNDPATSKGKRKVNKYEQAVLACLSATANLPAEADRGWTGKELAIDTKHPLNCITPRCAPLHRKGLIKDCGQRRNKQIVWVLV